MQTWLGHCTHLPLLGEVCRAEQRGPRDGALQFGHTTERHSNGNGNGSSGCCARLCHAVIVCRLPVAGSAQSMIPTLNATHVTRHQQGFEPAGLGVQYGVRADVSSNMWPAGLVGFGQPTSLQCTNHKLALRR